MSLEGEALLRDLAGENEPLATIIVESDNNEVARALGRVIGQAVQDVGFGNITVKHNDNTNVNEKLEDQTDWEQGKTMLEAIADATPSIWQQRIEVVSCCLAEPEEDEDDLPPEESAHIAAIVADD
ncbi:hypothetical protein [Burkholderia phage FLC9]|nr:hypothetical protein [Burkholderia phage FLC9]